MGRLSWKRALAYLYAGPAVLSIYGFKLMMRGVGAAIAKLVPIPQDLGRDDNSSQTYAWDGMQTEAGPGGTIPLIYGEIDVPGTVVSSAVRPAADGSESLYQLVVLGHGPLHSVGGILGDAQGHADLLGSENRPLPEHVRINGQILDTTPGAPNGGIGPARVIMGIRLGKPGQGPLGFEPSDPQNGFPYGPGNLVTVSTPLDDALNHGIATIPPPPVGGINTTVTAVVRFPGGLYALDNDGNPQAHQLQFDLHWRVAGSSAAWSPVLSPWTAVGRLDRVPFSVAHTFTLPGDEEKEVRVQRVTVRGTTRQIDAAVFTLCSYEFDYSLAYPGLAYVGIQIRGSELRSGGQPNYRFRVRGREVRVWDATNGWSAKTWAVPAAPHNFHTHPPGQNNAWVALDYMLAKEGIGNRIPEADVDLQAYRNLADYCDQEIASGFPRYRFDGVIDETMSAGDVIQKILSSCGAQQVRIGRRYTVRYSYRDAHGTVPARAVQVASTWRPVLRQVFASSSSRAFTTHKINTRRRPTVLTTTFLNRDMDYENDPVKQDDPNARGAGAFNTTLDAEPATTARIGTFGTTRKPQVRYQLLFAHNVNRLAKSAVEFEAGPDAVMIQPFDLFGVQTDTIKPGGRDNYGARLYPGFAGSSSNLRLDIPITVPATEQWAAHVIVPDASPPGFKVEEVWLPTSGSDQSFAAGADIAMSQPQAGGGAKTLTFAAAVPIALGPLGNVLKVYECVGIETGDGMGRKVQGLEWHPEFYDFDPDEIFGTDPLDIGPDLDTSDWAGAGSTDMPEPAGFVYARASTPGHFLVSWDRPAGQEDRLARVFVRPPEGDTWTLAGESRTGSLPVAGLSPRSSWLVSVSFQNRFGAFTPPGNSTTIEVRPDEFPRISLPPLAHLRARIADRGVLLEWDPLDPPMQQLDYYEVRAGTHWYEAQRLARTRNPFLLVELPNVSGANLWVRARSRHGLYSSRPLPIAVTFAAPAPRKLPDGASWPKIELVASAPGTLSDVSWGSTDRLVIATGKYHGYYTSQEHDLGSVVNCWWSCWVDHFGLQSVKLGALTFAIGSGEARWWSIRGREASPARRGPVSQRRVADMSGTSLRDLRTPSADRGELQAIGTAGSVGAWSAVRIEIRFHDGSAWGSWETYRAPEVRAARKVQIRLRLDRGTLNHQTYVRELRVAAAY